MTGQVRPVPRRECRIQGLFIIKRETDIMFFTVWNTELIIMGRLGPDKRLGGQPTRTEDPCTTGVDRGYDFYIEN